MQRDSNRTRIWFPMFSYFESSVDGIIPNEFDTIGEIVDQLTLLLVEAKDGVIMTAHRFCLEAANMNMSSRNVFFVPKDVLSRKKRNAATSTTGTVSNTPTTTKADFWRNENTITNTTQSVSNSTASTSDSVCNNFDSPIYEGKSSCNASLLNESLRTPEQQLQAQVNKEMHIKDISSKKSI